MSDQSIPEWLGSIAGFDPSLWWRFVVCTNLRKHPQEILGVLFDHAETGETHCAPRMVAGTEGGPWLIWMTRMDEAERDAARRTVEQYSQAFFGRGSMRMACPAGCVRRVSREQWAEFLSEARRVGPELVDVSLLG